MRISTIAQSMSELRTKKGDLILISDEDFEEMSKFKWHTNTKGYVTRKSRDKTKTFYLHIEIMKPPAGMIVDHENHNPLDNRRTNLRIVQKSANCRHRKPEFRMKAIFKPRGGSINPWYAQYKIRGKLRKSYAISLGWSATEEEAQAKIDKYHNLTLERQLNGMAQEDIYQELYAIRAEERRINNEHMWWKYQVKPV